MSKLVYFLSFLSFFLLFSCSASAQPYLGDSAFAPYLKTFLVDAKAHGRSFDTSNLSINFGNLAKMGYGEAIGLCYQGKNPKVFINRAWWDQNLGAWREELIHHELGHCLLGRGHVQAEFPGGRPVSMMYPHVFDLRQYSPNRSYYINELFSGKTLALDGLFVCGEHGD